MTQRATLAALAFTAIELCSCGKGGAKGQPKPVAPAKVSNGGIQEADLATVTLTEPAARRLGIRAEPIEIGGSHKQSTFSGEVVVPPGRLLTVTAPVAGRVSTDRSTPSSGAPVTEGAMVFRLLPLLPVQRDLRVTVEAEVATAEARVGAARKRLARAEQLLRDRVGTVREQEQSAHDLEIASNDLAAARRKLEQLNRAPLDADVSIPVAAPRDGVLRGIFASSGQTVAAGAPLFEVESAQVIWIRVPVYAGEATEAARATASIQSMAGGPSRPARRVAAPPTADPAAITVHLYYELDNSPAQLRPGEKVNVTLATGGSGGPSMLSAPRAAILYDIHGGTWLYEALGPLRFARRRVEVSHTAGNRVYLARGPKPGTPVVTDGAAELFGTEFGPGK